ncbi:TIGR02530 family flagellar biosynthesis protein [Rhodothermus profundi]|uniref:Flagellar operon protein n=1 Tax=Rhodothermus profundi TaxID=633813 RepID=A0A1M6X6E8_9BACT|nr:TIGR02530 family flagellar biosynthesis protein [Rhodothermus profundi]SHL01429.1 flagellar operon protein [Rhodothermus profundi]
MKVQDLAARVQPIPGATGPPSQTPRTHDPPATSFAEVLRQVQSAEEGLRLSAHARQRMAQRGIAFDALLARQLTEAVQELSAKGAREALVLHSEAAFIVSVTNRTVVTALSRQEMHQRIFTQIDSAYILNS